MLQALMEYGARLDSEPGFKTREIRWRIDLDASGELIAVLPLGDGKRGQMHARCPDMHNMNAGGRAHFLVESAQTAVLLFKPNEDSKKIASAQARHDYFVGLLDAASAELPPMARLVAALRSTSARNAIRDALAERKAKPTDWITWRLGDFDPRTDGAMQAWWRQWRAEDLSAVAKPGKSAKPNPADVLCFLTGELVQPLATHPKISGLSGVGGLGMDVMVGFDKAAFSSFGFDQSANAAISAAAAQQYADGLNDLIRNHSRKLANALVVHWFKEQVSQDDDPLAWLDGLESDEQTEAAAQSRARALLGAIQNGQRSDLGDNHYYAMTLSGASGRVMVRDWMEGSFEELVRIVEAWFTDLQIVARDGDGLARDPKFMAVAGGLVRELKDLPAPTAATLWKSAVARLPIPRPLMAQALARFRTDLVDKDQPALNHARMGLIKAYFVRLTPGGNSTVTAYLNPDHPDPAYHCGRLLAVLSNLQRAALGDVGAGVVQRYYAAASQTPGLILGRLAANARNHLGKLDGGLAYWFENQIADVMGRLGDRAPRILDLEGQGLFALGYYQQLAALRADAKERKSTTKTATIGDRQ
ncbi:MAG: type I-C CRISPR-associated protein Cas8c/Csd1 [Metallibacterium scheffleri]|jgi:CRISPR-associated protein Csd1|uniref:type I-C CRISPR-associated protein Cas8c/Csd1 n=1 Tax=Metallibacterium scheffleri TaxID=993689 RepID=UPI0026F34DB2|nr:type I-C CRISPR-associated protein Cas8c/Csd1 [Metallibacterium scheffleri]MCK9367870.1 type I-C CRISPR-associated protein Cas8c/Csd1 [Metallibacterium scheffleri]